MIPAFLPFTRNFIASLFASGEQGVWYDPSDFSTLFQDAAGTVPVTAVEQPVGLMLDKSKGLELMSAGLVLNPTFTNVANWSAQSGATVSAASNQLTVSSPGNDTYVLASQGLIFTANVMYKISTDVVSTTDNCRADMRITSTVSGGTIYAISDSASILSKKITLYFTPVTTGTYYLLLATNVLNTSPASAVFSNVIDQILPGNHASQSTATSRPVLSARVNRLLQTEDLTGANWIKLFGGTATVPVVTSGFEAPDGTLTAFRLQLNKGVGTTTGDLSVLSPSFVPSALTKTSSIWIKSQSGTPSIVFRNSANINALTTITNEWVLYSLANITVVAADDIFQILLRGSFNTSNSCDLLLWHPDDRASNDGIRLPTYQRVNTATDYDTAGFPTYLKFDGVDDSLTTASIDFSATDKMSVFAGARKLSDATNGAFVGLTNSPFSTSGGFELLSGDATTGAAGANYSLIANLSSGYAARFGSITSPSTNVVSALFDGAELSGANEAKMRVNGVLLTATGAVGTTIGSGSFANASLRVGRRGNATVPFNGHLYSLIVRGAQSSDSQITSAETYVNSKTGAY